jgi:ankyrin repeat protein
MMPNIPAQALFNACFDGDAAAVSRLLPAGGTSLDLSGPHFQHPDDKSTPLIAAALYGHTSIVRMILERAPNTTVDFVGAHGVTALLLAARYHHVDIVRLLADCGANLNYTGQRGSTPLHLAVGPLQPGVHPCHPEPHGARQLATVRALLQSGADTLTPPPSSGAPATRLNSTLPPKDPCALTHGLIRLNDYVHTPSLAARGPVDDAGETPLCIACGLGNAEVAVALLDAGADIDFGTPLRHGHTGFTPLMFAAQTNHASIAELLLNRGADGTKKATRTTRRDDAGSTALDILRRRADGDPDSAETFAVLRMWCCSMCGITSSGLSAMTPGGAQRLKRCASCPARGPCAHYCGKECQRADWVAWHRGECAEVRRVRQAA